MWLCRESLRMDCILWRLEKFLERERDCTMSEETKTLLLKQWNSSSSYVAAGKNRGGKRKYMCHEKWFSLDQNELEDCPGGQTPCYDVEGCMENVTKANKKTGGIELEQTRRTHSREQFRNYGSGNESPDIKGLLWGTRRFSRAIFGSLCSR